jgi:mono/diheme cytochrome c family protein
MRATLAALMVAGALAATVAGSLTVRAQAPASQWSGVYSVAQAGRGEKLFQDKCASCHAPDASGGDAPALKGSEFAVNWNDLSLGDLFDRIHVSMPMDAPGTLSNEQVVDILAFLLKSGAYPAGEKDLPADLARLKSVKFLAKDAGAK